MPQERSLIAFGGGRLQSLLKLFENWSPCLAVEAGLSVAQIHLGFYYWERVEVRHGIEEAA